MYKLVFIVTLQMTQHYNYGTYVVQRADYVTVTFLLWWRALIRIALVH